MAPRREVRDPGIFRVDDLHRLVFTPWLIGNTLPDRFTLDKGVPS